MVSEGTRMLIYKVKGALKAAKMRAGPKEPNPWKLPQTTLILQLQAPRITLSFTWRVAATGRLHSQIQRFGRSKEGEKNLVFPRKKSTAPVSLNEDFSVKKAQCPTWEKSSLAVTLSWRLPLVPGQDSPNLNLEMAAIQANVPCPVPAQPRAASKNKPWEHGLWPFQRKGRI